jgi:starch phosphorylase
LRRVPKPEPGSLDVDAIIESFAFRMMYSVARDGYNATDLDGFHSRAYAVRDRLMDRWFATQDSYYRHDVKRVYYMSLEFLLGRLLVSSIINLGAEPQYHEAMQRIGFPIASMAERENDAGLGNGGLGRLAACFLDSASTLSLPFYGYGIRYEYGIFRQRIDNGFQTEQPDNWLRYGNPWEVPRPDVLFPVKFYGRTEYWTDSSGSQRIRWVDTSDVYAMAYDLPVPGYRVDCVNSLRLWAAKSSREFDLQQFNAGAYVASVEDKTSSENISKVLYPPDSQYAGRELRLKQQHFFTSATIQDVIRRFKKKPGRRWEELPDKVAIQLNDTHPTISIPETMRVLVDQEALSWDLAWELCQAMFGYTNHTVLPEALESWSVDLVSKLLPRHWQIIEEIDRRHREAVRAKHPNDEARVHKMAIVDDGAHTVRMANLAIVGSHSVNGVAQLHSDIVKDRIFPEFNEFFPGKFNNKTNGITPRRWLAQANPQLSALVSTIAGDHWPRDLELLRKLEPMAQDAAFQEKWRAVKLERKQILAEWLGRCHSAKVDPQSIFDVQIKRIHEYKRQLLNLLHVIALYHRIADGTDTTPRTVILAGKAAPSYYTAKLIIKLAHEIANLVRKHPRVSQQLQVIFVPNYDVSSAELLFPATELSEQISTAGMEASGTGNMKAVLNGGVIMGTLDGANVEIDQHVGRDNIFIFGRTAEEIASMRASGYDPKHFINANPELRRVLDTLASSGPFGDQFQQLYDILSGGDHYFHCADFAAYMDAQTRASEVYRQRDVWTKMSIMNTARSGFFSADRTIAEYAKEIWNAVPHKVVLER